MIGKNLFKLIQSIPGALFLSNGLYASSNIGFSISTLPAESNTKLTHNLDIKGRVGSATAIQLHTISNFFTVENQDNCIEVFGKVFKNGIVCFMRETTNIKNSKIIVIWRDGEQDFVSLLDNKIVSSSHADENYHNIVSIGDNVAKDTVNRNRGILMPMLIDNDSTEIDYPLYSPIIKYCNSDYVLNELPTAIININGKDYVNLGYGYLHPYEIE